MEEKGIEESTLAEMRKAWGMLSLAGLMEPVWVTSMKLSDGFTAVFWTIITFMFLFLSMYLLGRALRMRIPIGAAYAVWVGIGAIGALVVGVLLFNEPSDLLRVGFVLLIVAGIVGVQVTSR